MPATSERSWTLTLDDDSENLEEILGKIIEDSAAMSKVNTVELERELATFTGRRQAYSAKVEKRRDIEKRIEQRLIKKKLEWEKANEAYRKARAKTRHASTRLSGLNEQTRNVTNTLAQEKSFLDNFAEVYTEDAFKNRAFMVMSVSDKIDSSVPVRLVDDPVAKRMALTWRTGPIYINKPDGTVYDHNFGKFDVEVVFRYANGNRLVDTYVHGVVNGGNTVWHGEYLHPHIQASGNPCLGNVSRMLITHMANQDVAQVIYTLTEYFCHYNHQDPYKRLMFWGVGNLQDMPRMADMEQYLEFDQGPKRACGLSDSDCLVFHSTDASGGCVAKSFPKQGILKLAEGEKSLQKLKEALSNGESNIETNG